MNEIKAKDLIKRMLEFLEEFNDCGPIDYGWQSDYLKELIQSAQEILKENANDATR
jgi:hypothetical protein